MKGGDNRLVSELGVTSQTYPLSCSSYTTCVVLCHNRSIRVSSESYGPVSKHVLFT